MPGMTGGSELALRSDSYPDGDREPRRAHAALRASVALLQMIGQAEEEEVIQVGLDESVRLSNSRIGYLHFVNQDQETIRLHSWSTDTKRICTTVQENHYPIDQAGVWVDCIHQRRPVIHNDYASLPHRKGLPAGHVQVVRDLSVPVMEDDRIVAVLGVGNKASDYDDFDIDLVSLLAENVWSVVRRTRVLEELQQQVAARTAELAGRNEELAQALAEIKTLSGILPICAHCKQVRDDQGYWNRLEAYLSKHSDAVVSHSICPDCLRKHYPDMADEILDPQTGELRTDI